MLIAHIAPTLIIIFLAPLFSPPVTVSLKLREKDVGRQVGEKEFKSDRKSRGSNGKIIIRFKAAVAGETSLRLIYHCPFEKNRPPIKTFEITVTVK